MAGGHVNGRHPVGQGQEAAKHTIMHKASPYNKNYPAQRIAIVLRLKNPALEDPKQSMTKMPHEGILTCFLPSPLPKLLIAT